MTLQGQIIEFKFKGIFGLEIFRFIHVSYKKNSVTFEKSNFFEGHSQRQIQGHHQ